MPSGAPTTGYGGFTVEDAGAAFGDANVTALAYKVATAASDDPGAWPGWSSEQHVVSTFAIK